MIIIDKNLEQLTSQYQICERDLVDEFSLKIRLGKYFYEPLDRAEPIVYQQHPEPSTCFSEQRLIRQNLIVGPGKAIITCSKEQYKMPLDHLGLRRAPELMRLPIQKNQRLT